MSENQTDELQLTLERVIRADRGRVFAAWTQPEQLREWSAPEGLTIEGGELDLRVGGRWRAVMVEPNGTRHEAFGTYLEVTPPERLVYTHAWERSAGAGRTPETVVTVTFTAVAGGTRVVLTQSEFDAPQSRDGHAGGWGSTLDRLVARFSEPV